MRMDKEQLNEIKAKYNVDELWSFSKVHCYEVSPYNYFLKYIKHIKETDKTSIYSESGSSVHSILEKFYNGEIASLQREKDAVKEVKKGLECGITLNNYSDIKVGDVIEAYEMVEVKR